MDIFKRKRVYTDETTVEAEITQLEGKCGYLQGFVDRFNALPVDNLQPEELPKLFNDSVAFITSRLTKGEKLQVGALAAKPEKIFELLEKPRGTEELLKDLSAHRTDRSKTEFYRPPHFTIVNDIVVPNPERIEQIREQNTVYIETETEKEACKYLTAIVDNLNAFKALRGGAGFQLEAFERDFIKTGYNGDFLVNYKEIKKLNRY